MTRSNLKRVIFFAALTLSLLGFPARTPLLAEDNISDRNALLARVKILKKNFEATSRKFRALMKKYELLHEQAQQIERRIEQEKQKIRELKEGTSKRSLDAKRHKIIEQLMRQLESQKQKLQ